MKAEQLLDAIGEIRDDFIADAQSPAARRSLRKFPVIVAAVLLCMALTVSALAAADVDGAYELIYALSPAIAQQLKPVRMSCIDNGIQMEVISAEVDGDTARIYIGLTDLEGDRIDASCDLYDSYDINLPYDMVGHCSYSHFDEATGTANFLVELSRMDGKRIKNDKITFSLGCFLSGKREYAGLLELDAADVQENPALQTDVVTRGYGWSEGYDDFVIDRYLIPDSVLSPISGVSVTGMGWVDGSLHIQTHYENILETDAHGYIHLIGPDGKELHEACIVSFWDAEGNGSYEEQIFDVTPEALAGCAFYGQFSTCDSITRGDWEITFPVG